MPPAALDEEDLPFPPGRSPFHLKGIVYRRHVEYVEAVIPGGEKAVNATFRSEALRAFFEQRFLASSWYDALPIVPVWYACARVLHQPPMDFLRTRTRDQAEHDIHGIYRFILKVASAEAVALRLPRAVTQYFDFGSTEVRVVRPGVVRFEHSGVPAMLVPWLSVVGEMYLRVALEIAGAKEIVVRREAAVPNGRAHGLELSKLVAEVDYGGVRGRGSRD